MANRGVETEIKLAVNSAARVDRTLRGLGFTAGPRERERDTVFDTGDQALRRGGQLLRLRRSGRSCVLTYKGRATEFERYKSRPEFETEVADGERLCRILDGLGYRPSFVYEKIRICYRDREGKGVASLDRTPIGIFLELEGPRRWIDRTAKALGFSREEYITRSYATLYIEYCKGQGIKPTNMVFQRKTKG